MPAPDKQRVDGYGADAHFGDDGLAANAQKLALLDVLASLDVQRTQAVEDALEAGAVLDNDGIAVDAAQVLGQ